MRKVIGEGEMLPKGYGVAYQNWSNFTAVCYPFPLNHLIGSIVKFWWKYRNQKPTEYIVKLSERYNDGFKHGLAVGLEQGQHQTREQIKTAVSNLKESLEKLRRN